MSENEQKAGCVDEAVRQAWRAAITLANNICVQESDRHNDNDEIEGANTGSECAKRIREYVDLPDAHLIELLTEAGATAALEAAALSPARSGEAVRDALVGVVNWYAEEEGNRAVTPPAICAALDALKSEQPQSASYGLLLSMATKVYETFVQSEAQGYRRRDRQFAISLLGKALESERALGVIAPRNESSGVSGGGEEVPAGFYTMDQVRFERWRNECPNGTVEEAHAAGYRLGAAVGRRAEQMKAQLGLTPAPQDSVRVGDGALGELVRMWNLAAQAATDPAEHNAFAACAGELFRVIGKNESACRECARLTEEVEWRKDRDRDIARSLANVGVELLYRDDGEFARARNRRAEELAAATPAPAAGADGEAMELRLCEVPKLLLHPDRAYVFTVDHDCASCLRAAKAAAGQE